jgi:16S rRNA (guanine966-N2)-methyltransferase
MRIIAGEYKNRRINMPSHIRPTQDKVRKALFDILGDVCGLRFLELFAGSGAVGLEALSRGAAELTLVEHNRDALKTINKNIASLKLESCEVYALQADKAIKKFHRDQNKFDIIFLDPPYYGEISKKTLQILGAYDILAPNGLIIAQHFKKESLPEAEGDLTLFRQSRYGDTALSFYKKR